jgi:hypothetical protein
MQRSDTGPYRLVYRADMPQCTNCYKPLAAPGLCRPCNEERIAAESFFPFVDEDEITEVMGTAPQMGDPVPEEAPPTYCGECFGTGDWGGGNSLIGCPRCQGTGFIH